MRSDAEFKVNLLHRYTEPSVTCSLSYSFVVYSFVVIALYQTLNIIQCQLLKEAHLDVCSRIVLQ